MLTSVGVCDAGVFDDDSVTGRRADSTPAPQQQLVDALCQMKLSTGQFPNYFCFLGTRSRSETVCNVVLSMMGVMSYVSPVNWTCCLGLMMLPDPFFSHSVTYSYAFNIHITYAEAEYLISVQLLAV